jgi:hypothetical protein
MRPSKLSLVEMFEKQRRYVVPLFQRPYVWEKDEQWEPLWQDITHQVDARLGDLRSEALHQLDRLELQVRGAVAPAGLEAQDVAAVGALLQAVIRERGSVGSRPRHRTYGRVEARVAVARVAVLGLGC